MTVLFNKKLYTFGRCTRADSARRRCRSLITDPDAVLLPAPLRPPRRLQ